jgi:hypothetical protein
MRHEGLIDAICRNEFVVMIFMDCLILHQCVATWKICLIGRFGVFEP